MGIVNRLLKKRMSDPVAGTYQLTSCSAASYDASYSNCRMYGVVVAPGVGPVAVEHGCVAPTKRWPQPGQVLPVTVDRADPARLEITWDEVPTGREAGRQLAEQQAQALAAQAAGTSGPSASQAPAANVAGDPGRPVPGAAGGGLTPAQVAQALAGGGTAGLVPAVARVLAVHDVIIPAGMPGAAPGGTADLTLDVELPAAGGYSTQMRISFSTPARRAAIADLGRTLPVLVNPGARDQIAIDTSRLGPLPA